MAHFSSCMIIIPMLFQTCDTRPELKIGGDGDLDYMHKCLGELLDEENENLLVSTAMADNDNNSDTPTKGLEPSSGDIGKDISYNFLFRYLYIIYNLTTETQL